jgi:hypothetical protein
MELGGSEIWQPLGKGGGQAERTGIPADIRAFWNVTICRIFSHFPSAKRATTTLICCTGSNRRTEAI